MFYEPIRYLATDLNKYNYLGDTRNKTCRFCNKNEDEVTFNKKAHTISKLLGNLYSLSNYECDVCNDYFCKFEKDLSQYLGPIRTIASYMNPSKRNPNFEHKEGDLKIERVGNNVDISHHLGKSYLIDNKKTKTLRLNFKISYIPLNIYKLLIKIAFCLFNETECSLFDNARLFLRDNYFNDDSRVKFNAKLLSFITPFEYFEFPTAYLFKKKMFFRNRPIP